VVPPLPGRKGGRERVGRCPLAIRAPHLYRSLRCFCLGAFRFLCGELTDGAELPFAFEAHPTSRHSTLYEYKPLVRDFVEDRERRLATRPDARLALAELRAEPAAAIFARAHAGSGPSDGEALFRSVLLPLLLRTAEACGGFDWDDGAFDRAYLELEGSLFRGRRVYAAVAPLVGLSAGVEVSLGGGIRVRHSATGELARHWREARGLLPQDFGREPDRLCVLEFECELDAADDPPDAPGEIADAVTALRLATGGALAAGPVLFERLDWRPFGIRPVLPIAAAVPLGQGARLDPFRGRVAADLRERVALADGDANLAEALDRWELSLFQDDPFRAEQLRESMTALLGGGDGGWAALMRATVLLRQVRRLPPDPPADAVRRALVETLMHGERSRLIERLDDTLVGKLPPPAGFYAARAS
jgi:hypothetical protein